MYHPPRGGVRGGADQFNWEDVKSDKHRENYLGHSVKAPVGRWQKGKDLLWYSKDRSSDKDGVKKSDSSEILAIKRAEEEAMLAALGHKVVRKETQPLSKEEMAEILKRNTAERDSLNVERVEGVGVMSARAAMLINSGSRKGLKAEGISFETPSPDEKNISTYSSKEKQAGSGERKGSSRKSSKKHKKEKKHKKKKKRKQTSESDDTDDESGRTSYGEGKSRERHNSDSVNRGRHSKHGSAVSEHYSKHRRQKDRHDSSSECEINSKYSDHLSKNVHSLKRKRHDSTSSSD